MEMHKIMQYDTGKKKIKNKTNKGIKAYGFPVFLKK
jgi:hypothetical protein